MVLTSLTSYFDVCFLGGLFDEQIKAIFAKLPKSRQNLFFSATITDTLNTLKKFVDKDAFVYEDNSPAEVATVSSLKQQFLLCPGYVKDAYMVELLRMYRRESETGNVIIFTNTCK